MLLYFVFVWCYVNLDIIVAELRIGLESCRFGFIKVQVLKCNQCPPLSRHQLYGKIGSDHIQEIAPRSTCQIVRGVEENNNVV